MTNYQRISRFPVPQFHDLPEDILQRILGLQDIAGFVPNLLLGLAHRPAEFRAFFAYYDALMEKKGGLKRTEREMIVVVTAAASHCLYGVVAHGAQLRVHSKDACLSDQISANHRDADLSHRQKVMLDFALKVADGAHQIGQKDIERMQDNSFSQDDIWDVGAISALWSLGHRMANLMALRPNDEFYYLGR